MSQNKVDILKDGIWANNPIFRMALGLCSTLAVTNLLLNTLIMAAAVTVTLILNSIIVSALRNIIPEKIRMISYMIITSALVIIIDMVIKIYYPEISKQLGPYVALIITNCIIMGRAEAFAINNGVVDSFLDAVSIGIGYSLSLIALAIVRELLGFGTLLGYTVTKDLFAPFNLLSIPPGAFFMLGIFILIVNTITNRKGGQE
ncbi:MAG: electron transport complex subunit RsxE [Spirochaetaceae bacterium]